MRQAHQSYWDNTQKHTRIFSSATNRSEMWYYGKRVGWTKLIAHWRGTRAWETPWQRLQRCGWAWQLGTGGAWSWYRASPLCTLLGPPRTAWHSGEWDQSQGTGPAPSADGKVHYWIASQTSSLKLLSAMTPTVQLRCSERQGAVTCLDCSR